MKGTPFVAALLAVGLGLSLAFSGKRHLEDEADGLQKKAPLSNFKRSSYGLESRGMPGFQAKREEYGREVQDYVKKEGIGEPQGFAKKDDVYEDTQNKAKRDGRPCAG